MQTNHRRVAIAVAVLSACLALTGVLAALRWTSVRRDVSQDPAQGQASTPAAAALPLPAAVVPANQASTPTTAPAEPAASAGPLISELMAANKETLKDGDGEKSDWIEVHNPTAEPIPLEGWFLTDDPASPRKWRFPAVTIGPRGYLVVFASDKNRVAAAGELHTNFKLAADGGYLALIRPDGKSVASEYAPAYPKQAADVSFGLAQDVSDVQLVAQGAEARVLVPTDDTLRRDWTKPDFDDSGWAAGRTGVGYDTGSSYKKLIRTDLRAQMFGVNATVYIRIPFDVADGRPYQSLSLRIKYDDGFAAYLNGEPVASRAAPRGADWNSGASSRRADGQAVAFEEVSLDAYAHLLRRGNNVLAIHGLNRPADSSDMLILPELRAARATLARGAAGFYFPLPTPGAPNATGTAALGPTVKDVRHSPAEPADGQDLAVRATVSRFGGRVESVALHFRVMFQPEIHVPMLDDGAHGDGAAGDGVYGAAIPAGASAPGQMVRYRVTAADDVGAESSWPRFPDPLHSEQYHGTVIAGATVASQLPVLQWFVEHPDRAGRSAGTRATVYFRGELYDNVLVRKRGVSSSSWPKPNYKFDFPKGHHFRFAADQSRVEEFNLQSTHSDKSYVRQVLAWETFRDAGAPYCICFPMRVHQNGEFFSVALFVEHPDERYLKRLGLDPQGSLYKFVDNSGLRKAVGFEKKTRVDEGADDLEALVKGVADSNAERARFLFDHVDLPQVINYLAAYVLTHDNDAILKNFFMYRGRGGGWKVLPWDKDLTFGRNHYPGEGVLNDTIVAGHPVHSHPLVGDSDHPKNHYRTAYNALTDAIHDTPATRQMFLRRLRTLMDEMLQAPETPADALRYERRIDALHGLMAQDVALDRARWGNPYGQDQDFATALTALKEQYLAARRRYLFETHGPAGGGIIPPSQPADARLQLGLPENASASGDDPAPECLRLSNTNTYAVDISAWRIEGTMRHAFPPGTVVPAGGSLYLCADPAAFRARASNPRGGEGLFVQSCEAWRMPTAGATIGLRNAAGETVAVLPDPTSAPAGPVPAAEEER